MRVLYVNHTGRVSGGEHSLISLLESLPGQIEPTVACPPGALAERVREVGVERVPIQGTDGSLRLHAVRTPRALLEMARAAAQVRAIAASRRAEVVHANSIRAGIVATAAAPPTVVHVRDCLPPGPASNLSLRAIGRADALIANSAHTRAGLGRVGETAHVVHNAVDVARFGDLTLSREQARARLGLPPEPVVLAVIAQITPWKAQDDAIAVLSSLAPRHPGATLLLVGSAKFDSAATRYDNPAYLDSLKSQAHQLGLSDSVRFLGERDDVPEILRAVDLVLVPSWEEPFGRSVIEAMAAGVPVVATELGGPPELLGDGEAGITLPPTQPQAWAQAIDSLLGDRPRMSAMGERGRLEARLRFGCERHAGAVLEVYEEVTSSSVAG